MLGKGTLTTLQCNHWPQGLSGNSSPPASFSFDLFLLAAEGALRPYSIVNQLRRVRPPPTVRLPPTCLPLPQAHYGRKEPEAVSAIKALYGELGMEQRFRDYEAASYAKLEVRGGRRQWVNCRAAK